eukprot:CAMPEP_0174727756 /NCGR_PEP_ID=MMETSP1094-20130205/50422_1 /TAXON_ID=156173 /ORGANISM="Chrysochromulina brevifilum, Strain UTEX LB 985" /LENGTH=71 /DNA_ID=CAMNT_0015929569 /DNA_START=44 /DNA_END=255 /DNA_ORIENTATION=+
MSIVGGNGLGEKAEVIATLQAGHQSMQSQVLSLQTHLRALLRKAEIDRSNGGSAVDRAMLDEHRGEVQSAL